MTRTQTIKEDSEFVLNKKAERAYSMKRLVRDAILITILVILDQVIKAIARKICSGGKEFAILPNFLSFKIQKNPGGPFGLLNDQPILFILVAVFFFVGILYIMVRIPAKDRYKPLHRGLSVLLAGIIANLVDRCFFLCVFDYIYILPIRFPAFNIADLYITISVIYLMILFLFKYKEQDLYFLDIRVKKYREIRKDDK